MVETEQHRSDREHVLAILQDAKGPLTRKQVLQRYQKRGGSAWAAVQLNPVIWDLVDQGKATFTNNWKLKAKP